MKKYYQLACMLLCWLAYASGVNAQSINSPSKEKAVRDVENRTIYAAVTGNPALDGFGCIRGSTERLSSLGLPLMGSIMAFSITMIIWVEYYLNHLVK